MKMLIFKCAIVIFALISSSAGDQTREKFKPCEDENHVDRNVSEDILSFNLRKETVTPKVKQMLICVLKVYKILTANGRLNDEETLKREFENNAPMIEAWKEVPFKEEPEEYAYLIYRAMEELVRIRNVRFKCGKRFNITHTPSKKIASYQLQDVEETENVKRFIQCILIAYRILGEDGKLFEAAILKGNTTVQEKLSGTGSSLLKTLQTVPEPEETEEDKLFYALNVHRTLGNWLSRDKERGVPIPNQSLKNAGPVTALILSSIAVKGYSFGLNYLLP